MYCFSSFIIDLFHSLGLSLFRYFVRYVFMYVVFVCISVLFSCFVPS